MELNPAENPFDWILKGNALRDGKRYDEAISAYEHALQIDPIIPMRGWEGARPSPSLEEARRPRLLVPGQRR
ncbi:tetratricopeptide repeat protein [Methanothrix sp.]|uniref:tetratricopeptide repeat protein n=1 Tax=Methanothrix sp. TaxID=90426 RepID=UPI003C7690B4